MCPAMDGRTTGTTGARARLGRDLGPGAGWAPAGRSGTAVEFGADSSRVEWSKAKK